MKTYENAAVVDIYVCGQKVDQITSFWDDFETFKYSLPHSHFINVNISALCYHRQQSSHTVSLASSSENKHQNNENKNVTIQLIHVPQCDDNSGMLNIKPPFGAMQLFKLTAISLC